MRESMAALDRAFKVVVQIVNVHVPITKTPAWSNMEISHNLVDPQVSFYAASLVSLSIQFFTVMLSFALFDALSTAESPRY